MASKCMRIVLANAPLQNGNRGCGALTYSLVALIDRIFKAAGREYEIWLTDAQVKSWSFDGNFSMAGVNYRIWSIPYPSRSWFRRILDIVRPNSRSFRNADRVLNVCQGDSYADIYGKGRFREMDRANIFARRYGIPYCFLPQTIGPFASSESLSDVRASLAAAARVMVRDRQSYEQVCAIAPMVEVREYIDVAFSLPYKKIVQPNGFVHVGINVSALLWRGGYSRQNQFALAGDYQELIRAIIRQLLSHPTVKVHLVAHVCEPSSGIENDYEIAYELWREFGDERIVLAPFALDAVDAKSYIAGLDFFLGSRMHATIAAYSAGVPVVPLAYSRKFTGLFEDTLGYRYVVDLRKCDSAKILDLVQMAYENRGQLAMEIERQNATVVSSRMEAFERDLRDFFKL